MLLVAKRYFYAILSGENKNLAKAELISICESENIYCNITDILDHVVIFDATNDISMHVSKRAGFVKEVGEVLAVTEAEENQIIKVAKEIGWEDLIPNKETIPVNATFIKEYGNHIDGNKLLKDLIKISGNKLTLKKRGMRKYVNIVITEGVSIFGLSFFRRKVSSWSYREPSKRPIYMPGTMKPALARVFVNLSRVKSLSNEILLDPFCGVGGFLIEACDMEINYLGSDINAEYVKGAKINLKHYGCKPNVIQADATKLYLRKDTIDGIATDPPYGRMTGTYRKELIELYEDFIFESADVLRRGRYLVFAIPLHHSIKEIIEEKLGEAGFKIQGKYLNWVHSSLTRMIYEVKLIE